VLGASVLPFLWNVFRGYRPHMVQRFREEAGERPKKDEKRAPAPSEVGAAATQPEDQDDNTDPCGK
jgi:cytochrome c oxidase subunit I